MKNTEMGNGMLPTLEMCEQMNFLDQIVGASEHHARTSQLQEIERVLQETDQVSFEKYFGYLGKQGKKIDLNGCSMKMLRECYQATEDLTTLPFSLKWTGGGYDIQWQLLNSKYHGVPQNRERVFTIGHSRRYGRREVFPIIDCGGTSDVIQGQQVVANTLTNANRLVHGIYPTVGMDDATDRQTDRLILKVNGYHKR